MGTRLSGWARAASAAPLPTLQHKRKPRPRGRGFAFRPVMWRELSSQPIEDLVGPEPLEPLQRLVEAGELVGVDAADLLDRAHVLVVQALDDIAHLAALLGQLDA